MRSMQTMARIATKFNRQQPSFLKNFKFCSKQKEESKDQDFNLHELLETGDQQAKARIIKQYTTIQDSFKELGEKLEGANSQVTQLDQVLSDQNKKLKDLRTNLKFQIEEVDLSRKRLEKEKELLKVFAITNFALELLDVKDNLERAIESNKHYHEGSNTLYEGVILTQKILDKVLKKNGVVPIDCLDKKYDPNQAEALMEVDDETKEPGTIVFIAQQGYMIQGRVLRPAKVGIVKART